MDFWPDRWLTSDFQPIAVLYKLTDADDKTMPGDPDHETQWGEDVTHEAPGIVDDVDEIAPLCTKYWIHAYSHPVIAVLLNSVHADIERPNLWRCTGNPKVMSLDKKVGCTWLQTNERIALPRMNLPTRIKFGITCAAKVYHEQGFQSWAKNWLSDKERCVAVDRVVVNSVAKLQRDISRRGHSLELMKLQAAYSAATAAAALGSIKESYPGIKQIQRETATAAVYANRVANDNKIDFDLITIAEEIFAARK